MKSAQVTQAASSPRIRRAGVAAPPPPQPTRLPKPTILALRPAAVAPRHAAAAYRRKH